VRQEAQRLASTPYRLHHSMAHFRILNAYRE
jgi:hypothetical protein